MARNVIVAYAYGWHKVIGATWAAVNLSGPPIAPKRKATVLGQEQLGDSPKESPSRGRKRRGGKISCGKKKVLTSPAGCIDFGDSFEEICLGTEDTMAEASPFLSNGRGVPLDRRVAYKYPVARKFLADLTTTHTSGELQDLLAAGLEFPELGMVKIET